MKPYVVTICSQSFESGLEVCLERNVLSDLSPKLLYAHFLLNGGVHRCLVRTLIQNESFDNPWIVEESSFNSEFRSTKDSLKKTLIKRDKDKIRLDDANFLAKAPEEVVQKVTDSCRSLNEEINVLSEKLHRAEHLILLNIKDSIDKLNESLKSVDRLLELYSH